LAAVANTSLTRQYRVGCHWLFIGLIRWLAAILATVVVSSYTRSAIGIRVGWLLVTVNNAGPLIIRPTIQGRDTSVGHWMVIGIADTRWLLQVRHCQRCWRRLPLGYVAVNAAANNNTRH